MSKIRHIMRMETDDGETIHFICSCGLHRVITPDGKMIRLSASSDPEHSHQQSFSNLTGLDMDLGDNNTADIFLVGNEDYLDFNKINDELNQ